MSVTICEVFELVDKEIKDLNHQKKEIIKCTKKKFVKELIKSDNFKECNIENSLELEEQSPKN